MKSMKRMISFVLLAALLLAGSVIPAHAVNGRDFIYSTGNKLKRGFTSGNVYMNTGFHFAVQFDDDWDLLSEEELIEMNNEPEENFDLDELFDRKGIITDMVAFNETYPGSNMSIQIENMVAVEGKSYTEKDVCRSVQKLVVDELTELGYKIEKSKIEKIDFAGSSHQSVLLEFSNNNKKAFEREIVLVEDDYAAVVSVATPEESFLDEMVSLFYSTNSKR